MVFKELNAFEDSAYKIIIYLRKYAENDLPEEMSDLLYEKITNHLQLVETLDVKSEVLQNIFTDNDRRKNYISYFLSVIYNVAIQTKKQFDISSHDIAKDDFCVANLRFHGEDETTFIYPEEKRKFMISSYQSLDFYNKKLREVVNFFPKSNGQQDQIKNENEKLNKYNKKELFTLLKELNFIESTPFKTYTPDKKEKVLSILLNCHIDYARDLINFNSHKYSNDEKNGIKKSTIDKIKKELES